LSWQPFQETHTSEKAHVWNHKFVSFILNLEEGLLVISFCFVLNILHLLLLSLYLWQTDLRSIKHDLLGCIELWIRINPLYRPKHVFLLQVAFSVGIRQLHVDRVVVFLCLLSCFNSGFFLYFFFLFLLLVFLRLI